MKKVELTYKNALAIAKRIQKHFEWLLMSSYNFKVVYCQMKRILRTATARGYFRENAELVFHVNENKRVILNSENTLFVEFGGDDHLFRLPIKVTEGMVDLDFKFAVSFFEWMCVSPKERIEEMMTDTNTIGEDGYSFASCVARYMIEKPRLVDEIFYNLYEHEDPHNHIPNLCKMWGEELMSGVNAMAENLEHLLSDYDGMEKVLVDKWGINPNA